MKTRSILVTVSAIALGASAYYYLTQRETEGAAPRMNREGEAVQEGLVVRRRTVDYESIIKSALTQQASFLTMTLSEDVLRDQYIETSIKYTPLLSSRARVRVKYHAEYPIGYVLSSGKVAVSGDENGLVLTLSRPQLIAKPSVKLLSYKILERGILIDEKTAVIKLQQSIQPAAEKRAAKIARRPNVVPGSEKALQAFLQPILAKQTGGKLPPIEFRYR